MFIKDGKTLDPANEFAWSLDGSNTSASMVMTTCRDATPEQLEAGGVAVEADPPPPVSLPPVPAISKAQALLWLLMHDKTEDDVNAVIASIQDAKAKAVATIEWKYREPFQSDNTLIQQLWPALQIAEDRDDAFREAALL